MNLLGEVDNHREFVVEFKDGRRDWVDPVYSVEETEQHIAVENVTGRVYIYDKELCDKWVVRPYSAETTYDPI